MKSWRSWRFEFLEAFPELGTIQETCNKVGITRQCVYKALKDPEFAKEFAKAKEKQLLVLEEAAWERAIINRSDKMLMFLLKAADPEKYGDRVAVKNMYTHVLDMTLDGTTKEDGEASDMASSPEGDD